MSISDLLTIKLKNSRLKKFSLTRSWIYEQLLFCSDNGSFNGFLQLPIRHNSIFPLSEVYGIMGWGLFVCMYSCMHVCMHKCRYISVYVCIMHDNTYICVYVCMYTNTNQIYNARKVTPKCESEAGVYECMYSMNFLNKITLFN